MKQALFPEIASVVASLDTTNISNERQEVLQPLLKFLMEKIKNGEQVNLNFICTHNSRRSHLSQVWAQTLASYFGLNTITCYSGGTEATALFPVAAETLKKQGFQIHILADTKNPIYAIKYAKTKHPIIGFSKTYDADFNPKSNFAAILTCDSANEACPIVSGADSRFAITYEDPKKFDGTPQQQEKYKERSLQIASEMLYIFKNILV